MRKTDSGESGTSLVPIGNLCPKVVICALAKGRRVDSDPDSTSTKLAQPEVSESYLTSRVEYAMRVLPGHYGPTEDILTNSRFLRDLNIPVSFLKDPNLGLCLETKMYDELNGVGQAKLQIDALRTTASAGRNIPWSRNSNPEQSRAAFTPSSPHFSDPLNFCDSKDGNFDIHCNQISTHEALGLLYAIRKAESAPHPVEEEALGPLPPPAKYIKTPQMFQALTASPDSYRLALLEEFDLEVSLFPNDQGFRIHGQEHRALVQKLILLAAAYSRRKDRNVTIGVISLVSAVGGTIAYLLSL